MSVYFTSFDETGHIRALCGFKGVFVPTARISDIRCPAAVVLVDESTTAEARLVALADLIKCDSFGEELGEELDHFRCVANSRAAALMWLMNPLIRWSHLRGIHQLVAGKPNRSLAMLPIKYSLHCLSYMWRAYPIVEASYLLRANNDSRRRATGWDMQAGVIHECIALLRTRVRCEHEMLGKLIDQCYLFPRSDYRELIGSAQVTDRPAFIPQLLARHADLLSPRLIRQFARATFYYVRGNLLRTGSNRARSVRHGTNNEYGERSRPLRLPQIMAADVSVDPAVLRYSLPKTSRANGNEITPAGKLLADVWWYILQICSEMVFYSAHGIEPERVFQRQRNLLRFHQKWKVDEELARTNGGEFLVNLLVNTSQRFRRSLSESRSTFMRVQSRSVFDLAIASWDDNAEPLKKLYDARATGAGEQRQFARCVALVANGSYIHI